MPDAQGCVAVGEGTLTAPVIMGPLAREQILLAFDFGTQRLGVAIGNSLTRSARPLAVMAVRSGDDAVARALDLISAWQPDQIIIGRPLGGEGAGEPVRPTSLAERFARRLRGRSGLPVVLVDERYSSLEAKSRIRQERRAGTFHGNATEDDAYAAVVILEQYLAEASAAPR